MPDSDFVVAVSDHDFDDLSIEREVLDDCAEVRDLSEELGIDDQLTTADAILNLRYEIGQELIEQMSECRIIARYGIGVDNIDIEAATSQDIFVTNVPDYCQEEVATHAIAMLLSLLRGLPIYDDSVAAGEWDRDVATPIHRISEQTLGIVGFGAIGRAVADLASTLGFDVVTSDPFVDAATAREHDAELVSFDSVLSQADAVTIHSPLTDETRSLFDDDAFEQMKESAILVNVARGPIIDGDALRAALDSGEIAAVGLDVFPDEPPSLNDPLRTHERVLASPHVAWSSEEANRERRHKAAENVRKALRGEQPPTTVNDL